MEYLLINRVAFTFLGIEIYWYGVIMCLAILSVFLLSLSFCKDVGYSTDLPINIAFVILPSGILSARLFAVLFDDSLSLMDFFKFRTGGLSIIGAVIGGTLGLLVYAGIKKEKNVLKWFDIIASVLLLAQAVGRWGNYFNSEVYGTVVLQNFPLKFFPFVVDGADGLLHYALFFYESVLDLIGFIFLARIFHTSKKYGITTACYLIYYGTIRTILETVRDEAFVLKLFGLPISQICSAIMVVIGIIMLIYINVQKGKKVAKNEE